MRDLEAAVLPGEDFDKAWGFGGVASLQDHPGLIDHNAEFVERRPVAFEQREEVLLASGFDPICADDDLAI